MVIKFDIGKMSITFDIFDEVIFDWNVPFLITSFKDFNVITMIINMRSVLCIFAKVIRLELVFHYLNKDKHFT